MNRFQKIRAEHIERFREIVRDMVMEGYTMPKIKEYMAEAVTHAE